MENALQTQSMRERLMRNETLVFAIGDFLTGMVVGIFTTIAVRIVVWPGMDMVIAMMIGMAAGMVVHVVIGLAAAPLVGMFNAMIPASIIGMYGGMLFGMRDSMAAGSRTLGSAVLVGAVFGAVVVAGVRIYDAALRGAVVEADE